MSEPISDKFVQGQHAPDAWLQVENADSTTYTPELRDSDATKRDGEGRLLEAVRSNDYAGASKEIMRRAIMRNDAGEPVMDHTHFKYRDASGLVQAEEGFHRAGEQAGEHWLKRFERQQLEDGAIVTTEHGRIAEQAANGAKAQGHEWQVASHALESGTREKRIFPYGLYGSQEQPSTNDLPKEYPGGVRLTRIERDIMRTEGSTKQQIHETYYGIVAGSDEDVELFTRDREK